MINPQEFRRALGHFATGVTIVTASVNGQKTGVTATSFNSVSLDPPLILWSLSKRSNSYAVFHGASHFAVNVLAEHQMELSHRFAQASVERFDGVACRTGLGGCLLLPDTCASFQCETFQIVEAGDHWIFLGKVLAFEYHARAPLLHHLGVYAALAPHPERDARAVARDPDFLFSIEF